MQLIVSTINQFLFQLLYALALSHSPLSLHCFLLAIADEYAIGVEHGKQLEGAMPSQTVGGRMVGAQ